MTSYWSVPSMLIIHTTVLAKYYEALWVYIQSEKIFIKPTLVIQFYLSAITDFSLFYTFRFLPQICQKLNQAFCWQITISSGFITNGKYCSSFKTSQHVIPVKTVAIQLNLKQTWHQLPLIKIRWQMKPLLAFFLKFIFKLFQCQINSWLAFIYVIQWRI